MKSIQKIRVWLTGLALMLVPSLAFATNSLNQAQSALKSDIMPWATPMQHAATDLFYALAAVEIAIFFLNHVLKQRGHEDLFTGIIKKTVTLMFFLTVINESTTWIPAIINGLAGGSSVLGIHAVTPSALATEALSIFLSCATAPAAAAAHNAGSVFGDLLNFNFTGAIGAVSSLFANSNPVALVIETLICTIIGLLAGIGVLMMALEFLMIQLESYLVMTLGIVMLAGGGLRFTSKYVGTYFDYAINVGVRLFALTAIAALVQTSIIPIMKTIIENVSNPLQMGFELLIVGAVIALLPKKASAIASSLLSGQSSFSGGELAKEGAMIAGGTVMAAGVVAAPLAGAAMAGGAGSLGAAAGAGEAGTMGAAAGGEAAGGAGGLSGAAGAGGGGGASEGVPAPKMAGDMQPGGASKGGAPSDNGVKAPSADSIDKQSGNRSQANDKQKEDNGVSAPVVEGAGTATGQGDDSGKADSIQSASGKTADAAAGGSTSGAGATPASQKDTQASGGQSASGAGGGSPAQGGGAVMAEGLAGAGVGAVVAEAAKGGASAAGSAAQAAPGAAAGSGQASASSGGAGGQSASGAGGSSPVQGGSSASQAPSDAGSGPTETGSPAPEGVSDGQTTASATSDASGVAVPQDVLERLNANLEQMNKKPGFVERRKDEIADHLIKHVKGSTIGAQNEKVGVNTVSTSDVHKE